MSAAPLIELKLPSSDAGRVGFLTFAFGAKRYRSQAVALAQSLRLHMPSYPLACITDHLDDPELKHYFDQLIPFRPEFGQALQQKLHFDVYTPFERTAFIDSDCLVVTDIAGLLARCAGHPFTALGYKATEGWWYMQIPTVLAKYRLEYVPRFNGGFYYFERNECSQALFARARQLGRIHKRMGIYELGEWFNEEVFYAVAMAMCRLAPVEDTSRTGMYTPDEFTDPFTIDVQAGYCHFNREHELYSPAIVHFFGAHSKAFHYLRECKRLSLIDSGRPAWYIGATMALWDAAYRTLVTAYNLGKRLTGKPAPFKYPMPMVPLINFGTKVMERFF